MNCVLPFKTLSEINATPYSDTQEIQDAMKSKIAKKSKM